MKVELSWLRELVEVPAGLDALAETLGLRGLEVAEVDRERGVLDLEVTANRPDCLGLLGVAREVAAAFDVELRPLELWPVTPAAAQPSLAGEVAARVTGAGPNGRAFEWAGTARVTVEDPDGCPRYAGQLAQVRVGPSPGWLAERLTAAGVRPINNVVDITNYVMLELGQPMHAFDFERLAGGEVRVRRAQPGEGLRTLDGVQRTLAQDMLVIADRDRPQAIAGVMGGADSEVGDHTRRVLFESAYFDPRSVRRTSRRLGLKTEASARFERGADPEAQVTAIARALALLIRTGAGQPVGALIDCRTAPPPARVLTLRRHRLAAILGFAVDDGQVERILRRLGFGVSGAPEGWTVRVPTFRVDVAREIDLIEEVGRHVGYDRVPETFPALGRLEAGLDPRILRDRRAGRILTAAGFSEAMTFAFLERAAAEPFAPDGQPLVEIANPLSEKFAVLRPSLLPGLLDAAVYNRRRERRDVRLFETGVCFSPADGESRRVAFIWTGAAEPEHWSRRARPADFFDAKGVVELLGRSFGASIALQPAAVRFLVTGRAAQVQAAPLRTPGQPPVLVGVVGQLEPRVAAARGFAGADAILVGELDLDRLARVGASPDEVRMQPLPRYPSVVRDLSVEIDDRLPAAAVRDTVWGAAPSTLVDLREFDRYRGEGIAPGRVSLSLRLTFRAPDRTLTDAEVDEAMARIVAALAEAHGAVRR